MIEGLLIRFAELPDLEFLQRNCDISAEIIQRKMDYNEILVAELNGHLVGFLQLEYLWSLIPYIALIRVLAEYRRQGVGQSLLEFAEDFLREQNHATLYSSSQTDEPEPQAWHRRVGFEECGIIAGINQGIGEIFFCKKLL